MTMLSKATVLIAGGAIAAAVAVPGVGRPLPAPAPAAPPAAFAQCAMCHTVTRGGAAGIGPNLFGVADKKAASRPGFAYSAALKKSGAVWNRATLQRFVTNPNAVAPGTTMPDPGLKTPAERASVAAYLVTLK